jgi:hypothetical protein
MKPNSSTLHLLHALKWLNRAIWCRSRDASRMVGAGQLPMLETADILAITTSNTHNPK